MSKQKKPGPGAFQDLERIVLTAFVLKQSNFMAQQACEDVSALVHVLGPMLDSQPVNVAAVKRLLGVIDERVSLLAEKMHAEAACVGCEWYGDEAADEAPAIVTEVMQRAGGAKRAKPSKKVHHALTLEQQQGGTT